MSIRVDTPASSPDTTRAHSRADSPSNQAPRSGWGRAPPKPALRAAPGERPARPGRTRSVHRQPLPSSRARQRPVARGNEPLVSRKCPSIPLTKSPSAAPRGPLEMALASGVPSSPAEKFPAKTGGRANCCRPVHDPIVEARCPERCGAGGSHAPPRWRGGRPISSTRARPRSPQRRARRGRAGGSPPGPASSALDEESW